MAVRRPGTRHAPPLHSSPEAKAARCQHPYTRNQTGASTLQPLTQRWDIRQLAVNDSGAPVDADWPILPNPTFGDRYGIEQIAPRVAQFRPDAVFLSSSFLGLPRYRDLPDRLGQTRPVLVTQYPVLGEPLDPRLVGRLARFNCVVMLAETVRQQFSTCLAQCRDIGWTDHTPRLAVIPHGLDTRVFHPPGDRPAARVAIAGLRDLPNDAFVVLNANRNQPRKRIDLKLGGFARFACDKPPGVMLSSHRGEAHHGTGLRALI
jgi:glycosyltransferase involved in cell wall biosynthesis